MNKLELTGTLIHVTESQKVGDSNSKMTFVMEYGAEYPKRELSIYGMTKWKKL